MEYLELLLTDDVLVERPLVVRNDRLDDGTTCFHFGARGLLGSVPDRRRADGESGRCWFLGSTVHVGVFEVLQWHFNELRVPLNDDRPQFTRLLKYTKCQTNFASDFSLYLMQ